MKYLKVWTNFEDVLAPLEDDEIGRLFLAMLHYAATGEEPEEFRGCESFLWPVAKRDIDTMAEKDEKLRQNGAKGGRPKTKENQTEPNNKFGFDVKPNESLKEKKRNEIKGNEKKSSFIDDDAAHGIQADHDRIFDAAEDAGFKSSNSVRASLLKLYAEYGLEPILKGFESCVKHDAPNLAYLEACLKGKPVKAVSKGFEQRDYSGVPEQMVSDLEKEIQEFKKGAS